MANGGFSFAGNNTIGSTADTVNLQTTWGTVQISGNNNVVYGSISSSTGAINLSNTTVSGDLTTGGAITLNGGAVSGNVTGNNGVTTTNGTTVGGNVTASSGAISLAGGSVSGAVSSTCCTITTNNTNISGGVSSASNTVSLNGGTVSGTISSSGGSGVVINNVTVASGSISATNVPISISNSTIGSSDNTVNVTGNNLVTLSGNTTVYGDVTAGSWSSAINIDNSSQVSGTCTPDHPRCNQISLTCAPPAGAPSGVTCICDNFNRSSLNPSPIFGSNWIVSTSDSTGLLASIVSNRLRLTSNTANNAKAATVPGIFPAAGNYISVDFKLYAYNGNGADGIAAVLSDYSVPAVPGAYGGSLGYAQQCSIEGFAGGWLGVGLDEYGNLANDNECRGDGGSPTALVRDSVTLRGSGSGSNGYLLLGSTGTLTPGIDQSGSTPAPGHRYRIVVDHSNNNNAWTTVSRDTGSGYSNLIGPVDVKSSASQANVPANWQLSFTGSTGGSNNIHEIDDLRICATYLYPPSGGSASGFAAIDEAYGNASSSTASSRPAIQSYLQGHVYTKLMGTAFKLNVAALSNNQVQTAYVVSGSKYVQVKLVDNTDGACVLDSSQANYCSSSCVGKSAVTGGSQVLTYSASQSGQQQTGNFTLNSAYKNLAVVMRECTTSSCSAFTSTAAACGVDAFSVRPTQVNALASSLLGGASRYEAGSNFKLTATIPGVSGNPNGYTGVLKVNSAGIAVVSPATTLGALSGSFAAAVSGTPAATAEGSNFTYDEVGSFTFRGFDPASDTTSTRGVYDGIMTAQDCYGLTGTQCDALRTATWTGVDSLSSKNDCVADSFSNVRNTSGSFSTNTNYGKFGCNFGLASNVVSGYFYPHHLDTAALQVCSSFTYSGQPFRLKVSAKNASGAVTSNYEGSLARNGVYTDANGAVGSFSPAQLSSTAYVKGVADLGFDNALVAPQVSFTYTTKQTAPSTLQLRVVDTDGVTSASGTEGTISLRSGRLKLSNVYGYASPLLMPVELQYWTGNSWVTNQADSCTTLAANNISASTWSVGAPVFTAGKGNISLTPSGTGSINLCVDLGPDPGGGVVCAATSAAMPWLQSRWPPGSAFNNDPVARATFGVFSPESRKGIYNREIY